MNSPEQLCERAMAGDREAASQLVLILQARVYSFLRRQCGSDADAADLTQQTFCQMWHSLPKFRAKSSVSTWVHGIAYNIYRVWRRTRPETEPLSDEWWETCPTLLPNPFQSAADRDMSRRLFTFVEKLEEDARETVHLHYYQGLSIEETAQAMQIATSTVKYRLREAIKTLRNQLDEQRARCSAC